MNKRAFFKSYLEIGKKQYETPINSICIFDKGNLEFKNRVTIRIFDKKTHFRFQMIYFHKTSLHFVEILYNNTIDAQIKNINL